MSENRFNLKPDNIQDLQKTLYEWQNYNFGTNQDTERALMGICEEVGELCHAQLKLEQGIRGNPEELNAAARDAVGDIGIYMLNYLSGLGLSIPSIDDSSSPDKSEDEYEIRKAVFTVVSASALVVNVRACDSIDTISAIRRLIDSLNRVCQLKGWSFSEILMETWAQVGRRDWIAYPKTGFPQ